MKSLYSNQLFNEIQTYLQPDCKKILALVLRLPLKYISMVSFYLTPNFCWSSALDHSSGMCSHSCHACLSLHEGWWPNQPKKLSLKLSWTGFVFYTQTMTTITNLTQKINLKPHEAVFYSWVIKQFQVSQVFTLLLSYKSLCFKMKITHISLIIQIMVCESVPVDFPSVIIGSFETFKRQHLTSLPFKIR